MGEMEKDIVTVKIYPQENKSIDLGISSIIGTRSSQEDTVFGEAKETEAIAVVCDGMGGLAGGELASKTAVECLVSDWFSGEAITDIPRFLEKEAQKADEMVFCQTDASGERIRAGTTIAAAIIQGNALYWLSVGDSKIYIIRGDEITAACREHNYRMTLDQKLKEGSITPEEYAAEEYGAEALISYLGIGNLSLIDVNRQPFMLEDGDIVLLCSDGLYKSLAEEEILRIVKEQEAFMQSTANALTAAALYNKPGGQDNTSVAVMRFYKMQEMGEPAP